MSERKTLQRKLLEVTLAELTEQGAWVTLLDSNSQPLAPARMVLYGPIVNGRSTAFGAPFNFTVTRTGRVAWVETRNGLGEFVVRGKPQIDCEYVVPGAIISLNALTLEAPR